MKQTPLKRKTPLKAKKPLQAKTTLKSYTELTRKSALKSKQKTARKLKEPYHSIFTDDLNKCYITGDTQNVSVHHIFGASRKALSEKYGFLVPLREDWHTLADYSVHKDRNLSLKFRVKCEEYYINVLQKTKEEWIAEFSVWWEERAA